MAQQGSDMKGLELAVAAFAVAVVVHNVGLAMRVSRLEARIAKQTERQLEINEAQIAFNKGVQENLHSVVVLVTGTSK